MDSRRQILIVVPVGVFIRVSEGPSLPSYFGLMSGNGSVWIVLLMVYVQFLVRVSFVPCVEVQL